MEFWITKKEEIGTTYTEKEERMKKKRREEIETRKQVVCGSNFSIVVTRNKSVIIFWEVTESLPSFFFFFLFHSVSSFILYFHPILTRAIKRRNKLLLFENRKWKRVEDGSEEVREDEKKGFSNLKRIEERGREEWVHYETYCYTCGYMFVSVIVTFLSCWFGNLYPESLLHYQ